MSFENAFNAEKPATRLEIILQRVQKGKHLGTQVTNFLRHRASIEYQYSKELKNLLSKSESQDSHPNQNSVSFDLLWEEMKKEVGDLAQYHADFSAQISSEAELIENYFSTDHQWTQFQTFQHQGEALVKECAQKEGDTILAQKKHENRVAEFEKEEKASGHKKSKSKLQSSEKKMIASFELLKKATKEWEKEYPGLFMIFQSMDEGALNLLKSSLIKFLQLEKEYFINPHENLNSKYLQKMEKYTTKQDIEFFITQDVSFFLGPKITNPPKIDAFEEELKNEAKELKEKSEDSQNEETKETKETKETEIKEPEIKEVENKKAPGTPEKFKEEEGKRKNSFSLFKGTLDRNKGKKRPQLQRSDSDLKIDPPNKDQEQDPKEIPKITRTDSDYDESKIEDFNPFSKKNSKDSKDSSSDEDDGTMPKRLQIKIKPKDEAEVEVQILDSPLKNFSPLSSDEKKRSRRSRLHDPDSNSPGSPLSVNFPSLPNSNSSSPRISNINVNIPKNDIENLPAPISNSQKSAVFGAIFSETINMLISSNSTSKFLVSGEVKFIALDPSNFPSQPLTFTITNSSVLEQLIPNPNFLSKLPGDGNFQCEPNFFNSLHASPSGITVLKYKLSLEDPAQVDKFVPLNSNCQWKCLPQQTQLLINYDYNPKCSLFEKGIELNDVSFLVGVDGGVLSCQSKPNGIWSTDKEKILWKLGSISKSNPSGKLLGKFELKDQSKNSPIAIKFSSKGSSLLNLTINNPLLSNSFEVVTGKYVVDV